MKRRKLSYLILASLGLFALSFIFWRNAQAVEQPASFERPVNEVENQSDEDDDLRIENDIMMDGNHDDMMDEDFSRILEGQLLRF